VSFETSFDSKQPKLVPKLVPAPSETKRLFRLFRFYTETESFDVLIEPKQTEDQPRQFDREHILVFFSENVEFSRFSWFFSVCFETVCFGCFASTPKQRVSKFRLNRNKQNTNPNSLKESIFEYLSENLGWFGLFQNSSVYFGCFDIGSKHRNKPKQTKHNRNRSCLGLFRFKPKFCLFVSRTTYLKLPGAAGRAEDTDVSLGHAP
jgi:hypothetical protein